MQTFFEPLMKLLKLEKIETDNLVFRLHYKVPWYIYTIQYNPSIYNLQITFPIFILFSAMLTAKQYFGDPIDCFVSGVPAGIVNTYCWTHGTYTVTSLEHITVRRYQWLDISIYLSMFTQRRPPTQEEMEHMAFYDHPGYIHPGIRCVDIYRYTFYDSSSRIKSDSLSIDILILDV